MTINEAATKYGTDGAGIWARICSPQPLSFLTDGRQIRLVAEERDEQGRWIVEERPA